MQPDSLLAPFYSHHLLFAYLLWPELLSFTSSLGCFIHGLNTGPRQLQVVKVFQTILSNIRSLLLVLQKQQAVTAPKAGMKKKSILHRISAVTDFQSSTKIEALREELHNMLARDPAAKAIVFSQFTSMLDLIYFRLTQVRMK